MGYLHYLLPGLYLIMLLSICINTSEYKLISNLTDKNNDFPFPLILTLSYILGYIIFGISYFKETVLGKYSYKKRIEEKIKKRQDFKDCNEHIIQSISLNIPNPEKRGYEVRELRNIVMSLSPEADQKIYTFTFRSELSSHIANVSLLIGIAGLIFRFLVPSEIKIFETNKTITIVYFLLPLAYFFLRFTRDRFYDISQRLPFSIYLAKSSKK